MATIEEMMLCNRVLELGMTITSQGKNMVQVQYAGHIDGLQVFVFDDAQTEGYLPGWSACDHYVYLSGSDACGSDPASSLAALLEQMDSLLEKDADGVPV